MECPVTLSVCDSGQDFPPHALFLEDFQRVEVNFDWEKSRVRLFTSAACAYYPLPANRARIVACVRLTLQRNPSAYKICLNLKLKLFLHLKQNAILIYSFGLSLKSSRRRFYATLFAVSSAFARINSFSRRPDFVLNVGGKGKTTPKCNRLQLFRYKCIEKPSQFCSFCMHTFVAYC